MCKLSAYTSETKAHVNKLCISNVSEWSPCRKRNVSGEGVKREGRKKGRTGGLKEGAKQEGALNKSPIIVS